ncbi:MAG: hypothetical protein WC656_05740 [Sulfurimonas sp.]|jgi:hypothetical protein
MEITLLLESGLGLVLILGFLIFLLLLARKKRTEQSVTEVKMTKEPVVDLEYLKAIIEHKRTTSKELQAALDLVLKHYGVIPSKVGVLYHHDFQIYMDILFSICIHPNTNKDIILRFDKELERLNPEYKVEINEAITKGLNSREA